MIYSVEDDDGIRGLMSYALTAAGFEVRAFPTAAACLRPFGASRPS